MTTSLTTHSNVTALVSAYRQSVEDIERACELLAEAEDRMQSLFKLGANNGFSLHARHGWGVATEAKPIVDKLRREAWEVIVERLEIRRMLSMREAEKLNKALKDGELPELTEESVATFAQHYIDNIDEMAAAAVVEVFDWLRPRYLRYSKHKTNKPYSVGPKVVISWMVERKWDGGGFHIRYDRHAEAVALCNVFAMLDGKGPIAKTYKGPLSDAIEASPSGVGETEYFAFRCFKNGNLHLAFKRLDLLKRFNEVAGGKRFRSAPVDDGQAMVVRGKDVAAE